MAKLVIKSITLDTFKGVNHEVYSFSDNNTVISGKNGSGKTTIFDAFTWLLFDKDSKLNSNPNIVPIDSEECSPKVIIDAEIDGLPIQLAKIQTRKVKPLSDGVNKVSVSNTYEINSVQKTERDFKAKLEEIGLCDSKKLISLTNLDVFTGQKAAEMRDILFSMASEKSDLDIASEFVPNLVDHLKIYSLDEIVAMQKSTKRKVAENYGKSGEILRAKIEGMQLSKVEVSDEQEIKDKQEEIKNKIIALDEKENAFADSQNRLMFLKFKEQELKNIAFSNEIKIQELETALNNSTAEFEQLHKQYEEIDNTKEGKCPCCGQTIKDDNFDSFKKSKLLEINRKAKTVKDKIDSLKAEISNLSDLNSDSEQTKAESDLKQIKAEIESLNNTSNEDVSIQKSELQNQLAELGKELLKIDANNRIDEQIENMRSQQMVYEQQLADADRILYLVDKLNKKKIELLSDDINSHFDIVDFKLFDFQKDGSFKEVCYPMIDEKRFGESTNTGREVLAKIDIVAGLQKFNNIYMPVFVDNAECLSEETRKRIKTDTQMIYLSVSEKDLEVTNG